MAGDPVTTGHYSAHDPANTRRFAGLIWLVYGVLVVCLVPVALVGETSAPGSAAGALIGAAAIATGIALVRNWPVGYDAMLGISYAGLLALVFMQYLAGPNAGIYQELYLVVALHTAAVHSPRRVVPFMGALAVAVVLGVVFEGATAVLLGDTAMHLVLWSGVAVLSSQLLKELREQRLSARRGEAVAQDLAETDALTGLGNRRRLMGELEEVLADASPQDAALLVLLDLDGFKAYNDSFGHPAGDELLRRLGSALSDRLAGRATAYRMGGDEFCVLARSVEGTGDDLAAEAVAALSEHGEGFKVTASHGAILLDGDTTAADALGVADRRMYACKSAGRISAGRQSTDVLLRLLAERDPELGDHVHDVAQACERVGRYVGLPEEEIPPLLEAAALHDIGKAAIPDAILDKPEPLEDAEWAFIRRHTLIGERILLAAPALRRAAPYVRSSHERWDGGGYPDGLAGDAIPLGARIIAVCDAYEAMTADRAYRKAMSSELALEELRRCAGTQFDAQVVEAMCAVVTAAGAMQRDDLRRAA